MGRPPKKTSLLRRNRMVLLFTDAEMRAIEEFIDREEYDGQNDLGRQAVLGLIESNNPVQKPKSDDGEA